MLQQQAIGAVIEACVCRVSRIVERSLRVSRPLPYLPSIAKLLRLFATKGKVGFFDTMSEGLGSCFLELLPCL